MKISRRDFLRLMGVTGAMAGGYSSVWAIPDEWREKLISGPRIETWKVSTCLQCPGGCGIRIRLIDDIPVRILGNPIAPVNRGFICPMGEAGLELLYHPDRITEPLKRVGEKGESSFEPISWDDALGQISQALGELRKKGAMGRFGFIMGDRNTLLTQFASEFVTGMGSPNFFSWRNPGVNELGIFEGSGEFPPFAFDLEQCDYLLTFGTDLLEETPSPVYFNRLYGNMKESRPRSGLKMVHVSPRMSQAGINGTEWVRIRPGSLGIFALGMVYVILRDKIYDQNFIRKNSRNTGNIRDFQSLVIRDFYPERVSNLTGIPANTVIRLAREFGAARAPLALSGGTTDRSENALFNQWAVASLNGLSGSFSAKGLWRERVDLPWGPSFSTVFSAKSGSFASGHPKVNRGEIPASWVVEQLPELLSGEQAPDLTMLMIFGANPIFPVTNRKAWKGFLGDIPQVVQFATLIDDTSPYADLILPAPTYLEQWDIALPVPNLPFAQLGMIQPVVSPKKGPRPPGDVLTLLAKELELKSPWKKPFASFEGYLQERMKKIFASGKGTPFFEEVSLEFLEELRKRGWQAYSYPAFADFWSLIKEKGGWWDPGEYPDLTWKGGRKLAFPTASRIAELFKERSPDKKGADGENMDGSKVTWLEKTIPEVEDGPDSFVLAPFTILFNITGEGASQPLLQELSGLHSRLYWQTWAEMNPDRARKLELKDGDHIRIVSGENSLTLPVRIVPTVSPETLSVPFGDGHTVGGRYARNIGRNPLDLMEYRMDPLSGRTSWLSTRVRVEKIIR